MADLVGLTQSQVGRLSRLLDAYESGDLSTVTPTGERKPRHQPGEHIIFGKLQSALAGIASSGGTPTSATLDQYKFTSTGGTTATGDTHTIYNLSGESATTVGWVRAERESRSGLFMFGAVGGAADQRQFLRALVSGSTGLDGTDPTQAGIYTITDESGSTQSAIGSTRVTNPFRLSGYGNVGMQLMEWGSQATTTGGTETTYVVLQAETRALNFFSDIRVTTGSTNVLEGQEQLAFRGWTNSSAGTWVELDNLPSPFYRAKVNTGSSFWNASSTFAESPPLDTVSNAAGTTFSAISSSQVLNPFYYEGADGDNVFVIEWGTQATTTGGTEPVYQIIDSQRRNVNAITDVRVTTGTTNVLEGLRLNTQSHISSTGGTWVELTNVSECT